MICPLCRQRKARRACPGVGQDICAVCCGTKRQVEIRCPDTCPYLATAREHPPAVVQRQRERDISALLSTMRDLNERQQQLLFLVLGVIRRQQEDPLRRLLDEDVAAAAAALASTLETAARGVIYEHYPDSIPAQRLVTDIKALFEEVAEHLGARTPQRDGPVVMRAVERGAKETGSRIEGAPRAYVELLSRVLRLEPDGPADGREATPDTKTGLILPG
jgi:hypothetical protein